MTATVPEFCYDSKVASYTRSHARWLRHGGGEAQCAFEGAVTALLKPGDRMLDAACGTGTVARRLLSETRGDVAMVLLDSSRKMLAKCGDIPAECVAGCMTDLPFEASQFDLVTCAWGIEVLRDPRPALKEFLRVTRPGGHICLVFCADRPARTLWGQVLLTHISTSNRGQFLDHNRLKTLAFMDGARHVQTLHCTGPAAALIIHT